MSSPSVTALLGVAAPGNGAGRYRLSGSAILANAMGSGGKPGVARGSMLDSLEMSGLCFDTPQQAAEITHLDY